MSDDQSPTNNELMMRLDEIRGDVRDMKHRLFGNGAPGLIRTVDRHGAVIAQWQRMFGIIVGAFIVLMAGGIVSAGVWVVRAMGH